MICMVGEVVVGVLFGCEEDVGWYGLVGSGVVL